MKIDVNNYNQGNYFPLARTEKNLRGADVLKALSAHPVIIERKDFSVMIVDGKGELFLRYRQGSWQQRIISFDKVFGVMHTKWRNV